MNSQPGPSRPPSNSGGAAATPSTSSSSSLTTASSSAVAQGAAGGRPSAFSTATRPVTGAPTAQSAVARGKQPASSVNNSSAAAVRSTAAPNTATGPAQQRQGTAATGSTNAGAAPGGAAVSVGGPAGLVRRTVLNSILVNTRQVRRGHVCGETASCIRVADHLYLALHFAKQKGNPVIGHIRQVPWEYGDIKCDYQVGATAGVLYLS